jgi:hypothetical protein
MYSSNSLVNSRLEPHNLISLPIIRRALQQTTTATKDSPLMTSQAFDRSSLPSSLTAKHT